MNAIAESPVPSTDWIIEEMQGLFRRHQTECEYADKGRSCDIDFLLFHALARLKTLQAVESRAVEIEGDEVAGLLQGMVLVQAALTAKAENVVDVDEPEHEPPKDVECPSCLAKPGAPCMKWPSYDGPMKDFHVTRWDKSKESRT